MGTDPVRTAAAKRRTPAASSVRPCVRPAGHGQPRALHVLALTGQDGNADAPVGTPSRDQHRDLSGVTTWTRARRRNLRKPGPRPMSARSCPASTMDATIGQAFGHRLSGRSGRTPSLHPARHGETGGDADREPTTGTQGVRTSSIATTTRRPAGTRRAPPVGLAFAAWQPRLARRWQACHRDRDHGSDQAAAWYRSTVQAAPRRTAVLGRLRVERRANGDASSVMAGGFACLSGVRRSTSVEDMGVVSRCMGVVACGGMWRLLGGGSVGS
jgi:hypothetical protein